MVNRKVWMLVMAGSIITVAAAAFLSLKGQGGSSDFTSSSQRATESPSAEMTAVKAEKAPIIHNVRVTTGESVGLYEKFELSLELEADYDNPYDPEQIDLSMELVSPAGKKWRVNGFYDGMAFGWKIRFSPDEVGRWHYRLHARGRGGINAAGPAPEGAFEAVPSANHGWIQVSAANRRYLAYRDGTSFYGVGIAYPWGITDDNLDRIASHGGNLVTYWNGNYDNAGGGGGRNQLQSATFGVDKIDPLKAARIDDLLDSFEKRGLHMNFVIWPHDSLTDKLQGWPAAWQMGGYAALGDAEDFYVDDAMWKYQERLYRYIIARWGHSRALGVWDLICEINGTDGWALGKTEDAEAWTQKVHDYFKQHDPYGHPTMGSMAGNREDYWDYGYRTLDLADRENYYDLSYDAYAEDIQARWNSYEKPLMIGETGNVTDTEIYRRAIWVSLANGLASSPSWWEYGQVSDEMLEQMRHFALFVNGIDFREPRIPVTSGDAANSADAQVWAMRGDRLSFGWMLAEQGGASGKTAALPGWPEGVYTVSWYDTWSGVWLGEHRAEATDVGAGLVLTAPQTERPDLAFTVAKVRTVP